MGRETCASGRASRRDRYALAMPEEYTPGNGSHLYQDSAIAAYRAYSQGQQVETGLSRRQSRRDVEG